MPHDSLPDGSTLRFERNTVLPAGSRELEAWVLGHFEVQFLKQSRRLTPRASPEFPLVLRLAGMTSKKIIVIPAKAEIQCSFRDGGPSVPTFRQDAKTCGTFTAQCWHSVSWCAPPELAAIHSKSSSRNLFNSQGSKHVLRLARIWIHSLTTSR